MQEWQSAKKILNFTPLLLDIRQTGKSEITRWIDIAHNLHLHKCRAVTDFVWLEKIVANITTISGENLVSREYKHIQFELSEIVSIRMTISPNIFLSQQNCTLFYR